MRWERNRALVDVEALTDLERGFTVEDMEHIEDAIREIQAGGDTSPCLAMPGLEAVYAKIHRELYGALPDAVAAPKPARA